MRRLKEERGMALLTIMLLVLILTVLGILSITVTGWEKRIAGLSASTSAAASAAESCVGTSTNIIQQTIAPPGVLPATALSNAVPPGPVPQANAAILLAEIKGQPLPSNAPSENNPDVPTGPGAVPNVVQAVNNYAVTGDIDRMYAQPKAGTGMQMFGGYEGTGQGAASGGTDYLYRIDCVAANVALGTTSRITAVYACTSSGESCQKKPL
jgi:Tfp pilus assembly protein PilX